VVSLNNGSCLIDTESDHYGKVLKIDASGLLNKSSWSLGERRDPPSILTCLVLDLSWLRFRVEIPDPS